MLARAMTDKLSQALGQTVIVESKPGAGATLGADYVAKSKPDGYTLLMGAVHHTIATSVYKKLPYDFQKDFAPITTVALVPNVLTVNASSPAKDVNGLIALAKASPGKLTYGSNGNGTAQHLIGTQFSKLAGVDILHVPYKGSAPLVTDLLGGQIEMSFDTLTPVYQHVKSGQAARAGGHDGQALDGPARRSDPGRVGPEGLRPGHLVRRTRAGRNAEGHRHAAQRRNGEDHQHAGLQEAHGRGGRGADRQQPDRDGQADQGRHGKVCKAGEGSEGRHRVKVSRLRP